FEPWIFGVVLIAVTTVLFSDWLSRDVQQLPLYLIVVLVAWAGYRLSQRAVATSIAAVCAFTVWDEVGGRSAFAVNAPDVTFLLFEIFVATVAFAGFALSAITEQRERAIELLEGSQHLLEARVRSRTEELLRTNEKLGADIAERQRVQAV